MDSELKDKLKRLQELRKKQDKLYEQLEFSLEVGALMKKHNVSENQKTIYRISNDNNSIYFMKLSDRGITIAMSELLFNAHKNGVDVTSWDEVIKFSKKPIALYKGRFDTSYNKEIMKDIIIIKAGEFAFD